MKKTNFIKLLTTLILVFGVTMTTLVNTVEATQKSEWISAPGIPASGISGRSKATRLYGTAKTATAEAAFVEFDTSTYGQLPSAYASVESRAIFVYLRDLDENNADDLIAIYGGNFYGRRLMSLSVRFDVAEGAIEATGDEAAELYIDICLCESMYDSPNACMPMALFNFRVGMN